MKTIEIKPNELQQKCIDNIKGKYLVLAGPGTGKTFTIIERINSMIKKGINPQKILCLTFSDAAANEMKTRLSLKVNNPNIEVNIYTYHSFCNEIINQNLENFKLASNCKVISQPQERQFIKECIDEIDPIEYRSSKNDPYVFLGTILEQIQEIKKNRLSKKEYFDNIKTNPDWEPQISELENKLESYKTQNKKIPAYLLNSIENAQKKVKKAIEIWQFYELYQSKLETNHYLDFNDMINMVLEKFELEPAFLNETANKYEYILVDEYQDTNKNQNEIIFNLTSAIATQNIFVVGDDDQIIYTFQGAKLDTIENFLTNFPDTEVICLKENMRSTESILKAARKIIEQDTKRIEINPDFKKYNISKVLESKNENLIDQPVYLNKYYDVKQEYLEIINEIESIINSDKCPVNKNKQKDLSQIAILLKGNAQASEIAQLLKNRNIPYELKEGKNIFEIKSTMTLYYYLKMLVNPELYSNQIFKLLLMEPFNINPFDYIKIQENNSKNETFIDTIKNEKNYNNPKQINNFIETFKYLLEYKNTHNINDIIIETASATGILEYYLNNKNNQLENILGLKKLIEEASNYSETYKKIDLSDFVEYLDISFKDDLPIKTQKPPIASNAVQISTYHSSKGREFEYVFMPTLNKNLWEADNSSFRSTIPLNKSEYKTDEQLKEMKYSDKLKLLYVGMTRAKSVLKLSYVQNIKNKPKSPSDFILNISENLKINEYPKYEIDSYLDECKKFLNKKTYDYKRDFNDYIDNILYDKYFSPTAVNTYLNCPREYLYGNIFNLSSKYEIIDAQNYGSAFHAALQKFINESIKNSSYLSIEHLINMFNYELNSIPISTKENRNILLTRGKKALLDFYNQLITTPLNNIYAAEYKLKCEYENKYNFIGIIDRIDKNNDGTYSIYDYKTGSSKPLKSVALDGEYQNYYIQLALYKYFFEKHTNSKVTLTSIIFPEDCHNNIELNIDDSQCEKIVKLYTSTIDKIKSHNFEPSNNKESCKYCEFKDFCSFNIL